MSDPLPEWYELVDSPKHFCDLQEVWGLKLEPVWGRDDGLWTGSLGYCWDDYQVIGVYTSEAEALERGRQDAMRWLREVG